MGFFEDTKPPVETKVVQEVKQEWLGILIASLFAFLAFILSGLGKAYWHVMKPLLTFEGKERGQIIRQLLIVAFTHIVPLYFIYTIPAVRDFISLSKTHTINHTDGRRILFPDRQYFGVESVRTGYPHSGRVYITYTGYTAGTTQKMEQGTCQMVPRGMKIRLSSPTPPVNAEGFKDEIRYAVEQPISSLSGFDYALEWIKRPKLWLNKRELDETVIEVEKESSWQRFLGEWGIIKFNDGMNKSFEVRALGSEHAVICF